ncbi:MAG: hypothetical protein ACREOU_14550 [Candidatus Eiseniibacteriota bacterium]
MKLESGAALLLALALACLGAAPLATGCAKKSNTRTLTERERDSTIGKSILPGAGVVSRSLEISDSAKARAGRMEAPAGGE